MSGLRAALVEAWAGRLAAAAPEEAEELLAGLAADRAMRVAELRALAARVTGAAPPPRAGRATLLAEIARPAREAAAEAAKRAAIGRPGMH